MSLSVSGRKTGAVPVSQILQSVFAEFEKNKNFTREDIQKKWAEIAGTSAAKHSRPVVYRKNILTIHTDSPAWMHDLTLRKRSILKQLKRVFGKDRIAEIQIKIGDV